MKNTAYGFTSSNKQRETRETLEQETAARFNYFPSFDKNGLLALTVLGQPFLQKLIRALVVANYHFRDNGLCRVSISAKVFQFRRQRKFNGITFVACNLYLRNYVFFSQDA